MRVGGTNYNNTTSSDFSLTTSPVIGGDYPIGSVNSA